MSGFLAFIASQYRRKPEDVATDVVAYLMHYQSVQSRVSERLKQLGFPNLAPGFKVKTRSSSDENGIPDITLTDRHNGSIRVFVENKLGALLTSKQPCAYLSEIPAGGLVLFVVPRWRLASLWKQVHDRCEAKFGLMSRIATVGPGYIGSTDSKYLAVIPWSDLIKVLSAAAISPDNSVGSDAALLVDQLRRLCGMEDQKLKKLNAEYAQLLTRKETASSVYGCVHFLEMVLDAAEDAGCFERERKRKSGDKAGAGYFGEWGQLANFRAWIGFDARVWSQKGESPIWIEFADTPGIDSRLRSIFSAARGKWPWLADPDQMEDNVNGTDYQLVVPIPLQQRVGYDDLLQTAVERIEQVATVLKSRPKANL